MSRTEVFLELFPHNQKAYEAAMHLIEEMGKAAVIHPTGTGKSFIAFKLAMEHPQARIVWLSPSEYIFQTQLENLKKTLTGTQEQIELWMLELTAKVQFLTYSKLMVKEDEIEKMQIDYIILDEFHRCGAAEWGKSVRKLLQIHKEAKVLGLSATNIRYLDNQRDMAEELFEGCIASYITLGEAIAREILPAPDYVISMYAYQEELKRLQKRVEGEKNLVLKQENEKLLEQLKRSLENADGLDTVFQRHMSKKDGKYIAFCSGKEHMEEMISHTREWFGLVDKQPHIYEVFYDNPVTSKAFADFKEDDSSHLKLLFCIDMLNEGVHVEQIDGVILLRPTVSPILYLQQIGRALSTGKQKKPVIFDIVNNFESLYSIDSLQVEFEKELFLLPSIEREKSKYSESFRVIDELRDCRQIFSRLNQNLSASWEVYFQTAKCFFEKEGHLNISNDYISEEGLNLGMWLLAQRRVYAGKIRGNLSQEQIERLESIGMKWENRNDQKFWQGYEALETYCRQHGNADVGNSYVTAAGFTLGKWVSNTRTAYKAGRLSDERKAALDELGMIWDVREYRWNKNYEAVKVYFAEHGNTDIPHDYVSENGLAIGTWIRNQREVYSGLKEKAVPLTEEQIKKLEALNIQWLNKYEDKWQNWYKLAEEYYKEHGNLEMRSTYCHKGASSENYAQESYALGKWINEIRLARKMPGSSNRKLTPERIRQMDAIGMNWD